MYLNRYGRCYKCGGAEEPGAEKSPGKPIQGHQNHHQYEENSNRRKKKKKIIQFSFTKTQSTGPNIVKSRNCSELFSYIFPQPNQGKEKGNKKIWGRLFTCGASIG